MHLTCVQWLLLGVACVLLGLVLLDRGFRRSRRGTAPHCRKCGYNLTGLPSNRCPECGTVVTAKTVVLGERRRRLALILPGLVACALASGPFYQFGHDVDWYQLRPTPWVASDLQSSDWSLDWRAWDELKRRAKVRRLPHSQLVDICLKEQGRRVEFRFFDAPLGYLERSYLDHSLSEQQEKTFLRQLLQFELVVRPRVALGDPVPYEVKEWRGYAQRSDLHVRTGWLDVWLDEEEAKPPRGYRNRIMPVHSQSGAGVIRCDEPGTHTLAVKHTVTVQYWNLSETANPGRLLYESDVFLEGTFEVLAAEPEGYMRLVDAPSTKEGLLAAVAPIGFTWSARREDVLEIQLNLADLPVNVASDMFVRIDSREYAFTTLLARTGATYESHMSRRCKAPRRDAYDLVIRSNQGLARETADMFEVFEGELVYEDVPVTEEKKEFDLTDADRALIDKLVKQVTRRSGIDSAWKRGFWESLRSKGP